jgi:putative chitinase
MLAAVLVLLTAQLGWATPTAVAAPSASTIHVVRWGENLFRIALRYGTTVEAIAHANGIANPNCIYAGQRLVIPGCGSGCCHGCSGHHGTGGFWYKVHWGDTLSGIAWRFGRSTWAIAHANGLHNPNCIYAGQKLYIP